MIGKTIYQLRVASGMTQEQFAALFGVSQQSVQKWENGVSTPDLDKIVRIAKHFDLSLDAFILGNDNRVVEEMGRTREIKPSYQNLHDWEFYSSNLKTEYQQSAEEGLDVESYRELFLSVARLPKGELKKKFGDLLFEIVSTAKMREGYPYVEPSDLEGIRAARKPYALSGAVDPAALEGRIAGAWMGRISGCMLGKTVEGIRTDELVPFLKETGNYPMHRYIYRSDLNDEILEKYRYGFRGRCYADEIVEMPADDDTNYVVLAQKIVDKFGRDFTPADVSRAWLRYQPKDSYCTAERVAFCNFVKGYLPPDSAIYKNPYREWVGAQIRGDYFGYINPGDPALAAEMAWRDASISHVKNGIYGEMLIAAMLAGAAVTDDLRTVVEVGLAEIPAESRLYEAIRKVLALFDSGAPQEDAFAMIHGLFDEHSAHDWCHTVSNAMIVVASLLYGGGDFGRSICMAVETGFDTDCNGATVGSIVGMAKGIGAIPEYWTAPFRDTLETQIFGIGRVRISDRIALTMKHIKP